MMKIPQLILPAFFLSIFTPPAMIQAEDSTPVPAAEQAPLLIAKQGSFAVGGSILQRPGTYDNSRFPGWGNAVEAGQSYHADHAAVDFQIPARARELHWYLSTAMDSPPGAGRQLRTDGRASITFSCAKDTPSAWLTSPGGAGRAERRRKPPSSRLPTSSSGLTSSGSANGRHSTREYSSLRTRIPWTSFSAK